MINKIHCQNFKLRKHSSNSTLIKTKKKKFWLKNFLNTLIRKNDKFKIKTVVGKKYVVWTKEGLEVADKYSKLVGL